MAVRVGMMESSVWSFVGIAIYDGNVCSNDDNVCSCSNGDNVYDGAVCCDEG